MRYLLSLFLLLPLTTAAWAQPPEAPPFPPPSTAQTAYQVSDLVFVGKVLSVSKDKLGFNSIARVQVQQAVKGKLARSVTVSGAGGTTHPARIFHLGETWLFYLGPDLHADSYANRVIPEAKIPADLKALKNSNL